MNHPQTYTDRSAAQEKRQPIIEQELCQLEKWCESLDEAVKSHAQRISSVLRMEPQPANEKNPNDPSTSVALADRMAAVSRRLAATRRVIGELTSQVEL